MYNEKKDMPGYAQRGQQLATPMSYGLVRPDNATTFINQAGILSAIAGGIVGVSQTNFVTADDFADNSNRFKIAHLLGYSPSFAWIAVQDLIIVAFQYPLGWDNTYFYLLGSDTGHRGFVVAMK